MYSKSVCTGHQWPASWNDGQHRVVCFENTMWYLHKLAMKPLVRTMDADNAIEYSRKAAILAQFQASGVIRTLPEEFNRRRHTVDDYLYVLDSIQAQFLFKHRHFLFVSGICQSYIILLLTVFNYLRVWKCAAFRICCCASRAAVGRYLLPAWSTAANLLHVAAASKWDRLTPYCVIDPALHIVQVVPVIFEVHVSPGSAETLVR